MVRPNFLASSILAVASALRSDGASASLCFGTDKEPIQDGQCQIYAVQFLDDDGDPWAVRIPVHQTLPTSSIARIVHDEMALMKKLNNAGFLWSPKLIGGDTGFDNPVGHPYLVMTWVHGDALEWTPTVSIERRSKVLRQLVQI